MSIGFPRGLVVLVPQFHRPIDTGSGTAAGREPVPAGALPALPEGDGAPGQEPQGVA